MHLEVPESVLELCKSQAPLRSPPEHSVVESFFCLNVKLTTRDQMFVVNKQTTGSILCLTEQPVLEQKVNMCDSLSFTLLVPASPRSAAHVQPVSAKQTAEWLSGEKYCRDQRLSADGVNAPLSCPSLW